MAGKNAAKFEIPRFDGTNFALWKLKMQAVLVKDGCAVALLGKDGKPEGMTDKTFAEKDEMAVANILLALEDTVLFNVEGESSAIGLWDKLKNIYEGKSLTNKIFLRRLYALKMKDGASVQEHLNHFNLLISKLMALDVKIEDDEKACLLLCSMPDSWDNLIMNLSHVKIHDLDVVIASLLTEELRRKTSVGSHGDAMVVRGRSIDRDYGDRSKSRSKSKAKKKVRCWGCGKIGHLKKECKGKRTADGDALPALERVENSNRWILDSGASFHMTPHKEWFYTYKSCNGGVVYMGDDGECEVVGIGDVRIKMFDGCIRKISDVRHVPTLRKSLLSIGMFDSHGLKFSGGNGQLKLIKGILTVAKGELVGNLYRLIGETMFGEAAVANTKPDSAMLWHKRLGHMGERGLQVLSKRNLLPHLKSVSLDFCEDCVFGKQHRVAFSLSTCKSKNFLDLIHALIHVKHPISLGGCSYFVSFIDDFSRKVWVYFEKKI
ncbi:hypothetical protein Scep_020601 [Stephania cephalantha]|uniref:CCHC-type domain-containing protein n=1 Tax=Stephania cephalantha TaxID=152367 RepID=A0AAP0ID78_9MAGN